MGDEPDASPPPVAEREDDKKSKKKDGKKKKKDKTRSAWISFVGRILAQVIGALATVVLGLAVAGKLPQFVQKRIDAPPAVAHPVAHAQDGVHSIAVLPLQSLSGKLEHEHVADGMTEALIADLARNGELRVVSRTSVMQYKGVRRPLPEIARELGVEAIMEGAVLCSGRRVRITAQLIDASTDHHLWVEMYDRDLRDIISLQDEVAREITRAVNTALKPHRAGG